ncbi:hypothetical protein Tco_0943456, partial [Tanacetum coccineum]
SGDGNKISWVKWGSVISSLWAREVGLYIGSLRANNLALLGYWWREGEVLGSRVWGDIVKIGEEVDVIGVEFISSCIGVLRDERDIRRKEASVSDKGGWVNNRWVWEWDWVRSITGRVSKEFEDLLCVLQHVVVSNNYRDRWRWALDEDGEFTIKDLSRLIEDKILRSDNGCQETVWNKLVPKKVNVFVWRALRGRLPVQVGSGGAR